MERRKRKRGIVDVPDVKNVKRAHLDSEECSVEGNLVKCLRQEGFDHLVCQAFKDHKICFDHLSSINNDYLQKMGINCIGTQISLMNYLRGLRQTQEDGKVFNDPIHGHIELHPLLIKIMDTPQFQRLRYIKQLGGGYFVFPGASHNRFEHSIGVAYLAGEFIESISRRQPELNISESDILCVKIAGLCHDLGHGPFSHMFDGQFIPGATKSTDWTHEKGSVMMLQHLIHCNDLWHVLESYNLTQDDLVFIKELIVGPSEVDSSSKWPYKGRSVEKSFLYEIVANKRTGIDVDKWDYFARDCHCLGIPNNFDWKRYTKFARVIKVNDTYQICCRDKEVNNLYEMFHTRASLHRRAYKHKTSNIVETMITEALLLADDHLFMPGKDDKPVRISEAIHDPYAYTNLNDSVIFNILQSTKPELAHSKEILSQLHKRQLYKCIGQTQPSAEFHADEEDLCKQIVNLRTPMNGKPCLSTSDIIVKVVTYDYGMKDKNPIDEMRFYTKQNPNKAVKVRRDQVSQMLPHTFIEKSIRVYCKKLDKASLRMAKKCFAEWCASQEPNSGVGLNSSQLEDSQDELEDFQSYGTPFGTPMKVEGSEDMSASDSQNRERIKKNLSNFYPS